MKLLSTFRGEDGPLVKEVRKVLDWFKTQGTPDVIFLSTIMLAGIGKVLKRELKVPVYGFLQGEDSFLDSLLPEYRVEAWKLLSSDVAKLNGCIAPVNISEILWLNASNWNPNVLNSTQMV